MDANGQRFWLLADAAHWPSRSHTVWETGCRTLRLASERRIAAPVDAAAFATASGALEAIPRALDRHEAVARWDAASGAIVVHSGHLPGHAVRLPLPEAPTDLCVSPHGVLYVALPGRVHLHDLRGRWFDDTVRLPGFTPWRIEPDLEGLWVLARNGRLARLTGLPLPATTPRAADYAPGVFRPDPENCRAPQLGLMQNVGWPAGERPVALAAHPDSGLALLSWFGDGEARLRRLDPATGRLTAALALTDARYAYALAWLDASRIAVRMPGRRDAPAFATSGDHAEALPLGAIYPLAPEAPEGPFAHRLAGAPRYPLGDAEAEPLLPLSISNLARHGAAASFAVTPAGLSAHLIDSASTTTVWHRLYVEAAVPPGTGFVVWLAATDDPAPPPQDEAAAWHAHGFGVDIVRLAPAAMGPHVPRAAWERAGSELPGHPGLAAWRPEPDTRGLYSVLIQNTRARVRQVTGRYLWVRVELYGDGRTGPDIAALRAYASRFDYAEHYLPRIYREVVFGPAAAVPGERLDAIDTAHAAALDAGGPATPALADGLASAGVHASLPEVRVEQSGSRWLVSDAAGPSHWRLVQEGDAIGIYRPRATSADFLARFLANFEGILTPLEDRIAAAHLLTDPASVPENGLDWLAGWIGIAFEPALPPARRREWLRAAPALARCHGTRRGLALALEIATGGDLRGDAIGAVRGGEIVLLEDFRLRRLLATLLGVDLAEADDPLLPGLRRSGNSTVGDTLVLSDAERVELLALFREEVAAAAGNATVIEFLGRLAHRATVLVHQNASAQDLGLLRRIVALEAPAHVEVRVATATWPFLVGVASLIGVDTYLGPPRAPRPARAGVSALGMGDYVLGPAALDPRMAGAAAATAAPTADAGADRTEPFGRSFTLDGSGSHAAPGRSIEQYVWRLLPPLS